jgi:hypothetical protein
MSALRDQVTVDVTGVMSMIWLKPLLSIGCVDIAIILELLSMIVYRSVILFLIEKLRG